MSVVRFPVLPLRAIKVECVSTGRWVGKFSGDCWTPAFRTMVGSSREVMDEVRFARQGLPIDTGFLRRIPLPDGFGMRIANPNYDDGFTTDPRPAA